MHALEGSKYSKVKTFSFFSANMKIAPLVLASAAALETSSTAQNLLAAVGHRNVTKMEALIQNLAEESISEPAWKFDDDIKKALHAIRDMFVKSIQTALNDAHRHDQEDFNCFTESCFGKCNSDYKEQVGHCHAMEHKCHALGHSHHECRLEVYSSYKTMAQSCAALHCFEIPDPPCIPESCLCPDLSYCHRAVGREPQALSIAYPDEPAYPAPEEPGYPSVGHCEARAGHCNGKFGGWLQGQIEAYTSAYAVWIKLYNQCKHDYHAFLKIDMSCDKNQKEFEQCLCERNACEFTTCSVNYEQCKEQCWAEYEEHVHEKECLEKDRKIDWSATKKIECYIDVLLHDYTKEELLTKCGSDTCVNVAREEDYKHCATICPQVDHDGVWPNAECVDQSSGKVSIDNHDPRVAVSQYLLGDGHYKCDANGPQVMTRHRGGVSREAEVRCTEHLDIDYQLPEVGCCDPRSPEVCDEKFHWTWYLMYDVVDRIGCINECCPEESGAACFPAVDMDTSYDGHKMTWISVTEHSHAWAYNRCRCTDCIEGYPTYPPPGEGHECGKGAHTISKNGIYEINEPILRR